MSDVPFQSVLVIEGRADIRMVARDALKEVGVPHVVSVGSVGEAWSMLADEEEMPDWILTGVERNERKNGFHILDVLVREPRFVGTRCSLIVSEDDLDLLPAAFELGILSYHKMPFTKQGLADQLRGLFAAASEAGDDVFVVAAKYLREYLTDAESFESLVRLEESLVSRFPRYPRFQLNLAEAYYLSDRIDDASQVLKRAQYLEGDLAVGVKQLKDMVGLDDAEAEGGEKEFGDAFGVESCFVAEPDEVTANQISETLVRLGVNNVETFDRGDGLFEALKNGKRPDLIITEWKLAGTSGAQLVQKLPELFDDQPPVLITSSLLKREDRILLTELGIKAVVEKPFQNEDLANEVMAVVRDAKAPQDAHALEIKLRQAAEKGDEETVEEMYRSIQNIKEAPSGVKSLAEAQYAYVKKDYLTAKEHAFRAFQEKGEAIVVLNLLGKILLQLGETEEALKCFNRAQELSPGNLARLCSLAEVSAEQGDEDQAKESLEKARAIDGESERVQMTEGKVSLNLGEVDSIRDAMTSVENFGGLVSYMNNRAVSLVRQGQYEEAIKLYDDAFEALPESKREERAAIQYNRGLAYARMQKLKEAAEALSHVSAKDNPKLAKKAENLGRAVQQAEKAGIPLSFRSEEKNKNNTETANRPMALHAKPGQIGLHMIFDSGQVESEAVQKLLEGRPTIGNSRQKAS